MNRSELESKHLAELHALAAEAGIDRYRMLSRAELLDRLSDGGGDGEARGGGRERQPREGRQRRERRPRERRGPREAESEPREQPPAPRAESAAAPRSEGRPRRRRRRRRFGRRPKTVRVHELLLAGDGGRQAIVYGESRGACTALLREVAAELADAKGPDPIGLLIDPSPEELADWKRDAPRAEIVSAGKSRHAEDAIAQAIRRAEAGEEVVVLIDSLTRFAESFGNADEARDLFEAGSGVGGSLTVVAAVERSA